MSNMLLTLGSHLPLGRRNAMRGLVVRGWWQTTMTRQILPRYGDPKRLRHYSMLITKGTIDLT